MNFVQFQFFFIHLIHQVRPCVEEVGFKNMMLQLRSYCENSQQRLNQNDVHANQYYAGQMPDGYWYR